MTRPARALVPNPIPAVEDRSPSLCRLIAEISAALRLPVASRGGRIEGALRRATTAPDLLRACHLECDPRSYSRHVVHADPERRFTVLSLVWAPGQGSPAHAHRVWCAYAVREGTIEETLFAFDTSARNAIALGRHERRIGYAASAPGGMERGHRLVNRGAGTAVSIHVYGVDAADISSGVNEWMEFA